MDLQAAFGKSTLSLLVIIAIIIVVVAAGKIINHDVTLANVAKAKALIQDSTVKILDVRTPQEFSQGHIKGAQLIPVYDLSNRIQELAPFKDRPILVYCHSGNRSTTASRILKKNGFTKIFNLQGGITAWNSGGNKTVKGD
jgi:rhodanese-related sulfurtransferase